MEKKKNFESDNLGLRHPDVVRDMAQDWDRFVSTYKDRLKQKLSPRNHKARIIGWTYCWPASIVLFLFRDAISRFFRWLARMLRHAYSSISDVYLKSAIGVIDAADPPNLPPAPPTSPDPKVDGRGNRTKGFGFGTIRSAVSPPK